ncbi:MAG: phosphatase PAP2 family protein [Bacteroidetes bacterium]|nr:phosphatase PAP2 family protein [Bacteroidota bacterium]
MRKIFPARKYLSLVFLIVANYSFAQNAEQRFLEHLTENRTPGMTHFMQGVSNSTTEISLAVPLGLFITSRINHDEVMQQKSLYVLENIAAGSGIAIVLKYVVNRPRPATQDSLIIPASDMGSPSFPSGHASIAFSTATALSLAYPKWYVIAPAYLWACTVGFSRMYLGVHYPTDVFAGAVIGTGSAFLCREVNKWLFHSKDKKARIVWY